MSNVSAFDSKQMTDAQEENALLEDNSIPGLGGRGGHNDDNDDTHSSRSDESFEEAGLVSRLSDEEDRAQKAARYEGVARLGGAATTAASRSQRLEDELDDNDDDHLHAGYASRSSISNEVNTEGIFRDRFSVDRRRASKKRSSLLHQIWLISREALPTLLISLLSLIFSGELLIHLARWPVFRKVDKLFILIPVLLNLKGNLEGNQSLRLSTSANIGELDIRRTRETLIFGNLALLQVQALIVSLFAGILAFLLGLAGTGDSKPSISNASNNRRSLWLRKVIHTPPKVDKSLKLRNSYFEFVLVIATGMLSASLSSAILGSFMCALIVITRQAGGNPDNIASPLAGSLGDLLTLSLLGLIGSFLVRFEGTILATLILIALSVTCFTFFIVAYRNAYVRELLSSGWIPLVVAMFISSGAGLVLDAVVTRFEGFALLAPVVTGLPGACSAIFVSRISTVLHSGKMKHQPSFSPAINSGSRWKLKRFFANHGLTEGWMVPITLFSIGLSIMICFLTFIYLTGQMRFGIAFYFSFILVSALIIASSLLISHILTLSLWKRDYDPDIYCLPYVSSIVDVIGQSLLVLAYYMAQTFGDHITAAVNDGKR